MNYVNNRSVNESANYWNDFYSNNTIAQQINNPTQFAAFTLGEMKQEGIEVIYDLGCGNGRDTKFFIDNNCKVVAADRSLNALQKTRSLCDESAMLETVHQDFGSKFDNWPDFGQRRKILYARFLIHSLPNQALINFISQCGSVMNNADMAFFEYRTSQDQNLKKEAPHHFRNFVCPSFVNNLAEANSLKLKYSAEGIGFAKFRDEDAFVSRQVFQKKIEPQL